MVAIGRKRLLSTRQTAAVLGVSVDTVRRHAARGTLPVVRLGPRGWMKFRSEDVEAVLASGARREAA